MSVDSAELLDRYRQGDPTAARELLDRYSTRLAALARTRLSPKLARRVDVDDVLQSTYRSFFTRVANGQLTVAGDDDLWALLATIALRKLGRLAKRHRAGKRSIDRETPVDDDSSLDWASREPSPADVIAAGEELHWLLARFDAHARRAIVLRLQGVTIEAAGAELGRSERTIRRWLATARQLLEQRWKTDIVQPEHGSLSTIDATVAPLKSGDYSLQKLIGAGGVAKIYRSVHKSSGQRVAIKVLRKSLRHEPLIVERFVRESKIVAQFDHAGIVKMHGLGALPGGGFFMVMDWIEGQDLMQLCLGRPLEPELAARMVSLAAHAISYAHERGVIHCDLKPGNVLVDNQQHVYVTDFGFACLPSELAQGEPIVAGTAGFMAPEQLDLAQGTIGPATDVYGLGALLCMLSTGHPPRTDGWLPADVPAALREVCGRCLALKPEDRYQAVGDVARALEAIAC